MHQVFPTSRRALVATALVVALAVVAALAAGAGARPRTTAVVPDGTYGVNAAGGEYVVFTVRNHRVSDLNFQMQITCETPDTPGSEQRFFTAGANAPQNRPVPRSGKLRLNWQERGDGRLGQVAVELKFGARDVANFAVIVPEERTPETGPEEALESCNGVSSLRFHRGFELTPIP